MNKAMTLSMFLLLGVFALLSCVPQSQAAESSESGSAKLSVSAEESAEPLPDPPTHPLTIPGLRERRFAAEDFTLLPSVPAVSGLEAREFSYRSDGYLNYGLIEYPAGPAPEGGWPVIIVAHGYIPPNSYSTVDNYRMVTRYYASGGFMVIKPDYRSHGRSEGPDADGNITRTVDYSIDVLNIIAGVSEIPDADPDNVFLYGHSMGGEIGLRILTVNNSLKGASLWAGVTEDYPENTLYFVRKRAPDVAESLKEQVEAAFTAEQIEAITPNNYLDAIDVPILVHHGTEDESVPFDWSIPFRRRLDEAGVDFQFFEYPGENHNISKSFYKILDKDMAFFRSLVD